MAKKALSRLKSPKRAFVGDPYGIRSGLRICKIAEFIDDFAFFNKEIIKEIEQFYLSILVFFQ